MSASATVTALKAHLADLQMPGSLEAVDDLRPWCSCSPPK